jgi:hypothetical protein
MLGQPTATDEQPLSGQAIAARFDPDPNEQQQEHTEGEWDQSRSWRPREILSTNHQTDCQTDANHPKKDLTKKGTRGRSQFENVGFLAGRIRDDRDAGSWFLNQSGGLRLRVAGRRRDEDRRLTLLTLDALTVQ